ncbi:MAG: hypothetical protein ACREGL_05610, partial [Alphaproteobacteria bacterium]
MAVAPRIKDLDEPQGAPEPGVQAAEHGAPGSVAALERLSERQRPIGRAAALKIRPTRLISGKDMAILAGLPVLSAIAWTMPESWFAPFGRVFGPMAARFEPASFHSLVGRIRRAAAIRPMAESPEEVARQVIADHVVETIQLLKTYQWNGWRPRVQLRGGEHITAALERGRGVVLWVSHFAFGSLTVKMALHGAGFAVTHLGLRRHGFSGSRFGMRFLNPVRTRIEDRYLERRVFFAPESPTAALRALYARLNENRVVSIAAREVARRPFAVPVLGGLLPLGTGALDLAHATGAALLPVFSRRDERGAFEVVVEPPLETERALPRATFREDAARRYVE